MAPENRASPLFFVTAEECLSWINDQRHAWQLLISAVSQNQIATQPRLTRSIFEKYREVVETILRQVASLVENTQVAEQTRLEQAALIIKDASNRNHDILLDVHGVEFAAVSRIAGSNVAAAAFALAAFTKSDYQRSFGIQLDGNLLPSAIIGFVEAAMVRNRLGDSFAAPQLDSLSSVIDKAEVLSTQARELIRSVDLQNRELKAEILKRTNELDSEVERQKQAFIDAVIKARDEFTTLQQTYSDQLSLRSAVSYWSKRKEANFWVACLFFGAALLAGVGLAVYFQHVVGVILDKAGTSAVDWPHYSVAAVILLLGTWVLRVLLRLAFGSWDAANDSGERSVLVESFLALQKESREMSEAERLVLLQAIYARTGDKKESVTLLDAETIKSLTGSK